MKLHLKAFFLFIVTVFAAIIAAVVLVETNGWAIIAVPFAVLYYFIYEMVVGWEHKKVAARLRAKRRSR